MKVLSKESLEIITWFLKNREDDIALDMENFGELKTVFRELIGREPEE